MKVCVVSFTDPDGIRHSVEVQADSLYEAAVLACRSFRQHKCEPPPLTELRVEVTSKIAHTLTMRKVEAWLNGTCRNPKERLLKDRLKEVLSG